MKIPQAIVTVAAAAMLLIGLTSLAAGLNVGPVHVDVSPAQTTPGGNVSVGVSAPSLGVEVGATADTSLQVGGSDVGATVGAGASVTSPVASVSVSVPSTTVGASTSPGGGTSGGSSPGGLSGGASSGASTPATGGTSSLSPASPGSSSAQSGATPPAGSQAAKDSASTVARNVGEAARAQAEGATVAGLGLRGGDRDGLVTTVGRAVAAAARSVWFPIALLIAFGLYLILQRRLDRGSKLLATGHGNPEDEVIEII